MTSYAGIVWCKKPGEKGAARIIEVIKDMTGVEYYRLCFLEGGRPIVMVKPDQVEALDA